jgi:integrase
MASVVERATAAGERRLFVVFWATDRDTGKKRKIWASCPLAIDDGGKVRPFGIKDANLRKAAVELGLKASGGLWPLEEAKPEPEAPLTFRGYSEQWLAAHGPSLRPQTLDEYRRILEGILWPRFGDRLLLEIRRSDVKACMNEWAAAGSAANTVRNRIAPLRAIYAQAIDDEIVAANPAARQKRVGKEAKKVTPPTASEVVRIIEAARPDFRPVLHVAAGLGLRRGELYGLRWRDVDFAKRVVRVETSNIRGQLMDPKTDAGNRLVPLFESARKALAAWQLRQPAERKQPDSLVFADPFGRPFNPAVEVEHQFQHALRKSKLGERAVRFHDLRHYAVSQLIAQGANVLQIARVAGHADPAVTLRVYAHLFEDGLTEAAMNYDPMATAVRTG